MIKKTIVGLLFVSTMFCGFAAHALTFSPAIREYAKNPGESMTETIRLFNDNDTDKMFYPVFVDFTAPADESGSPNFVPEGTFAKSGSLAQWFAPVEPIIIKAKGRQEVKLTINIPKDAEPGGHYGAVFFSDMPSNPDSIGVGAQTGPIFLVNVLGDIKEDAKVIEFKANKSFNVALPINLFYRVQNNGSVHESPKGTVTFSGWWPRKTVVQVNERGLQHVLPHSIRRLPLSWEAKGENTGNFLDKASYEWSNLAFGHFTATLDLKYGITKEQQLQSVASFWVLPWHLMIIALLILLVVVSLLKLYNRAIVRSAQKNK